MENNSPQFLALHFAFKFGVLYELLKNRELLHSTTDQFQWWEGSLLSWETNALQSVDYSSRGLNCFCWITRELGEGAGYVHHICLMMCSYVEAPFMFQPMANSSPDVTTALWCCNLFHMEIFLDCQMFAANELLQLFCTFGIHQEPHPHLPELFGPQSNFKNQTALSLMHRSLGGE